VETVVIRLEQLVDLTTGGTITCGPVRVRVAQTDLDGLMAALAAADMTKAFRCHREMGRQ
jgi:hypothetical protein